MDPLFEKALNFVLKWEGGYVCDPDDLGGATNHGITQTTYNTWRHNNSLVMQPVELITPAETERIYREFYWDRLAVRKLSDRLYVAAFNAAVNMGVTTAKILLNQADGDVKKFLYFQAAKYRAYAAVPSQQQFLKGWLNRLNDLRKFLDTIPG